MKKSSVMKRSKEADVCSSNKIFLIFILIFGIILISEIESVHAVTSYYNFSNLTNTAYWGAPASSDLWSAGTNATSAQYTNMSTNNAQYAQVCSTTPNDFPFWRFNFTINESTNAILWINITYDGRSVSSGELTEVRYWNFSSGAWVSIGSISTSDAQTSVNITSGFDNYIDASKKLVVSAEGTAFDSAECVATDFVQVAVGFIVRVYPQFTSYAEVPANASQYSPGTNYKFNSTVTYTNGTVWLEFNGVNYTATNYTFDNYNVTLGNFAAGNYDYRWWAYGNGTENDINNSQTRVYNITKNYETVYTLFNTTSPVTYPNAFTVYSNATSAFTLYRNGSVVSNNSFQGLAAGTYNFTTIRTDNVNYSDVYDEQTFVVNKAPSDCNVSFNASSVTYGATFGVWANCDSAFILYRNGTTISNNSAQNLAAGTYNFTAIRTDQQNYSIVFNQTTFVVNKDSSSCGVAFNETSPIYDYTTFAVWSNCTSVFTLYRNGTEVSNNSAQHLVFGVYNFTVIRTDTANYTNFYEERNFVVLESNVPPTLNAKATAPATVYKTTNTILNATCWDGNTGETIRAWGRVWLNTGGGYSQDESDFSLLVTNATNTQIYNYSSGNYSKSNGIKFEVWCGDLGYNSTHENTTEIIVQNSVPTIPTSANLNTTTPYTDDAVLCTASGSTDADSDSITYWYKFNESAGTLQDWSTSQTYSCAGAGCDKNDVVTCWAKAATSDANSSAYSGQSFTVQNSAPTTPTSANLNTTTPYTNDAVLCTAGGSTDADSDSITYWYKFNESAGTLQDWSTSQTYSCAGAGCDKNDVVTCWAKAATSDANSSAYSGQSFTVQNSAPVISNPQTTVTWNANGSTYTYDYDATDADNDGFTWYDNTTLFNVNSGTGVISDTPVEAENTTYTILISLSDGTINTTNAFSYKINDATPPQITSPSNATITYLDSLFVDFDATDFSGLSSWAVNDTTRFTINSTGGLKNNTILAVGVYLLNVTINDTYGNQNYSMYKVTVSQNSEKVYTLFNTTSPVTYPTAFIVYSNATTDFVIYRNGTVVPNNSFQGLAAGTYNFTTIRTDKTNYSDVYNEQTFQVNKATPTGSLASTKGWAFIYDTTATNVSYTETNTGDGGVVYKVYQNATDKGAYDLKSAVGTYGYVLNTTGGENYSASASMASNTLSITQDTASSCGVVFNTTSPVTYPDAFKVWTNCTTTFTLYRNGTSISNDSVQGLAAGTYNFTVIRTDQQNYSNVYEERNFVVNKATPTGSLASTKGWAFIYDTTATNVSYTETNTGDGGVVYKVYQNATDKGAYDLKSAVGTYGYVLNTTGGENYSASASMASNTLSITQDTASSCGVVFNTTSPVTYPDAFKVWTNCTTAFTLYRNGTSISNDSVQGLAAGTYNFTVIRTDQQNYSNVYEERNFVVNKATPTGDVTGTSPITYLTAADIQGSETNSGDTDVVYKLYRDGVEVSNPDNTVLGYGVYNYVYNTTGGTNYSSSASLDTFVLTVNKATPIGSLTSTKGWAFTYDGTATNVSYTESNTGDADVVYKVYQNLTDKGAYDLKSAVGTYGYVLNTTGGENYSASANINSNTLSITQVADSCGVVFNTTSPVTYPDAFKVWTNCTTTFTLYRNGTSISNNSDQALGASTYNFTVIRTDQQNYSNIYESRNFVVNKATTALSITGTTPITYGTTSDFVGVGCPGQLTCSMNETNKVFGVGTITFNYSTAGNENASANWTIKNLVVNQNPEIVYTLFNTTSPVTYPTAFLVYSNSTNATASTFTIYRNGTPVSNNSIQGLAAGTYNFTTIRTDNVNYSDVYDEENFVVNQETSPCEVYFNTTSPITYLVSFKVWTNCNSAFTLYRNGTPISNYSDQFLAVGTYNFTVIRDDKINYPNYYDEETFVVNKENSSCGVLFNTTSYILNETVFAVWSNCTSAFTLYKNGTPVSNNSAQKPDVGVYNFTAIRTDQVNYTYLYEEKNMVVWAPSKRYSVRGTNTPLRLSNNSRVRILQ